MTKEQAKYIRENYRHMPYKKIAENIDSNYQAVRRFCMRKGLRRTSKEEFQIRSKSRKRNFKKVDDSVPHYYKREYNHFDFI